MTDPATDTGRRAFLRACTLDVAVPKPGNVSLASAGHGMQAAQFIASAQASALALCVPGRPVGRRIEAAVAATWQVAGCNTNLGILLLAAPLLAAAEQPGALASQAALRAALAQVLAALDADDAAATFRAIAAANPGGLGDAPRHDVRQVPTIGLVAAMALAADHDSVARQYTTGYADVFELGARLGPASGAGPVRGGSWTVDDPSRPGPEAVRAVQRVYLEGLRRWPDSHVRRKHGGAVAQQVQAHALRWPAAGPHPPAAALARWDAELKAAGLNPGTTADLTVATLLAAGMLSPAV